MNRGDGGCAQQALVQEDPLILLSFHIRLSAEKNILLIEKTKVYKRRRSINDRYMKMNMRVSFAYLRTYTSYYICIQILQVGVT